MQGRKVTNKLDWEFVAAALRNSNSTHEVFISAEAIVVLDEYETTTT